MLIGCAFIVFASVVRAQDIEPRAYSNAPVGVNFLIAGYAYTRGGLTFDPSLPIDDVNLHSSNAVLAYARALDLWGKSGKFDIIAPHAWLSGSADYASRRSSASSTASPIPRCACRSICTERQR